MKELINHNFEGKIWNTSFGEEYCVLEIRDELTRKVSFSCVNLLTGDVLWQNLIPEKSWWLSLVKVSDEYLFLHKYSSNQKPEPEGLLVLNIQSGEVLERINDWIFFNYADNILMVYQLQNNQPVYENIFLRQSPVNTGTQSQTTAKSIIQQAKCRPSHNSTNQQSSAQISLTHYPEDSPHFPTIYKFLYRLLNIDAVKAVDYLEISNKIIISYYIYRDKSFLNYLLVTNRSREILLNDLIAETEGIGIDTFTVKSDTLLYVKNQTQFIGYKL
ncbi:MAG: hypothetical protein RLZZ306_2826 [Bacteroidota bacterium]|jgi:hypothetical protein